MEQITALAEQQARLAVNARSKLEEITGQTTATRAKEIEAEFDAMMAEYDALEPRIERERAAAASRLNRGDPRRPTGNGVARGDAGEMAPNYKTVFDKALRHGVQARIPQELRAQSAGTDSAGGYTVPTEFSGEIDRAMAIWGPMWDAEIVRELETGNGRRIEWPSVDDTAHTGRSKAENAAVDDDGTDDVVFGQKLLDAYVYDTGLVRVPIELLQDSAFDMEALLRDLFAERLGRTANEVLTTGDGSSKPLGIVPASSQGKAAAASTALAADEIIDLLHSVDPAYRTSPRARWMFNDTTLAAIRKLKDGEGNYLWQVGNIRRRAPAQILGHPYSINQAMADAATTTKPIVFGDFSRYVVRKVGGFEVLVLRERYAENFQVGLIGFRRFDGTLLNSAAIKHMVMA